MELAPAQTHWRTGRAEVAVRLIKETATKLAQDMPDIPIQELFHWADAAHSELFRVEGWSPDQILFGRQLRPLD